jgi:hypothetical protein
MCRLKEKLASRENGFHQIFTADAAAPRADFQARFWRWRDAAFFWPPPSTRGPAFALIFNSAPAMQNGQIFSRARQPLFFIGRPGPPSRVIGRR